MQRSHKVKIKSCALNFITVQGKSFPDSTANSQVVITIIPCDQNKNLVGYVMSSLRNQGIGLGLHLTPPPCDFHSAQLHSVSTCTLTC